MLRLLWNRMSKEEKGFTLVELLVVIVILGVLVGIGVPTYRGFIDRSYEAATLAELQAVSMAIKFYFMEHEEGSFELSKLKRYLGDEDFAVGDNDKSTGKYLDYSLTVESGQEYIIAQTDAPKRSKKAWVYLKDIGTSIRRGDIVFDDPNPTQSD
jgi:prepilin-type N-terminal cleavage/methylation domain-containing protein